jgi:hypothetical protein
MLRPNVTVYATRHALQRYSQRVTPITSTRKLAAKAQQAIGLSSDLRGKVKWVRSHEPKLMLMDEHAVYLLATSFRDPTKFHVLTVLNRGCLERGEPQPGAA